MREIRPKPPKWPVHVTKVVCFDDDLFDLFEPNEIPLSGIVREITIVDTIDEYTFTIGGPLNSETRPNPSKLSKREPYLVWFSNGTRAIASHDKMIEILDVCHQDHDLFR